MRINGYTRTHLKPSVWIFLIDPAVTFPHMEISTALDTVLVNTNIVLSAAVTSRSKSLEPLRGKFRHYVLRFVAMA